MSQDGEITKGHTEILGGDRYVYNLDCSDSFYSCICMSKLTKWNTVVICSLLYINNTSIKSFLNCMAISLGNSNSGIYSTEIFASV